MSQTSRGYSCRRIPLSFLLLDPSFAPFASRMILRDRTEQADFFFPLRSCAAVGLRKEKSLLSPIFQFLISIFYFLLL